MSMPWLGSARSLEVQVRRLLVAGFAALAVLLGLVATTGVASAASSKTAACDIPGGLVTGCTPGDGAAKLHPGGGPFSGVAGAGLLPPCTVVVLSNCRPVGDHHHPGGGLGGGYGGHWIPGGNIPWGGPSLYGHQLWVEANLGLDICGFGNSYQTFVNRNLRYRSDIDRYLGASRWQSLYSSGCANSIAVVPNGLSLVNGQFLNLDLLGLQGGGLQSVCAYPSFDVFNSRLGGRFGNRWDSVRGRFGANGFNEFRELRRQAQCTIVTVPSSTTIVQQPAQTLEAAPSTDPAPAVAPSADDGASKPMASGPVPSGAVQTGGDSIGFVLAHNRAV